MRTAPTWPDVVREAARLLLRINDGESDEESSSVIYAVDTSIAHTFGEPDENMHAVQMLAPVSNDANAADLTYVLSDLALRCIANTRDGGLLLPGHDEEFLRQLAEIHDGLATRSRASLATLEKASAKASPRLDVQVNETGRPLESLNVTSMTQPRSEVRSARWTSFIARSRLRSSSDPTLRLPELDQGGKEFRAARRDWLVALRAGGARPQRSYTLVRDSHALAALGLLNAGLESSRDPRRISLLTTDDHMQNVARQNPTLPGASRIRDLRLFVRDLPSNLGAFLSDGGEERRYGVREWLVTLLTPFVDAMQRLDDRTLCKLGFADPSRQGTDDIRALFRESNPVNHKVDRLTTALKEWDDFLHIGVKRYAITEMKSNPRLVDVAMQIERSQEKSERLHQYLVRSAAAANVSSLVAGLYMSLARRSSKLADELAKYRMPVALRAGTEEERQRYRTAMDRAITEHNINFVDLFQGFVDQYRAHLYYGVYFAAIGRWDATILLAKAALAFADTAGNTSVDGCEAAYLLSVARRHRTQSSDDLATARAAYRDTVERFDRRGLRDIRLEVEGVALDLMCAYTRFFLPEWDVPAPDSPLKLYSRLEAVLDKLGMLSSEIEQDFTQLVRKQALGNVLSLAMNEFIRRPEEQDAVWKLPSFAGHVASLQYLNAGLARQQGLAFAARSHYLQLLLAFGQWLQERSDVGATEILLGAIKTVESGRQEMPYDKYRFPHLRVLVEQYGFNTARLN